MKPQLTTASHLTRLLSVLLVAATVFLLVQLVDLALLRSFTEAAYAGGVESQQSIRPAAYVPVASRATIEVIENIPNTRSRLAEVGDGGDLGRRVQEALARYEPLLVASVQKNMTYVPLAPLLELVDGELRWSAGCDSAAILLPDALITFRLDSPTAYRNYRSISLSGLPLVEYGQLKLPIKALPSLCNLEVDVVDHDNQGLYHIKSHGNDVYLVVRERMYSLEVSRSGRWLQVYFLGEPLKRYPICTGEGNNTPVGDFHIQNKAVWPPWNAYWGEYMPGGSSRNPLGARWLGTTARGRATGRVIGIHGTNQPSSIGRRISGGCMRMHNHDAIELYNNIPVGTPLSIHE